MAMFQNDNTQSLDHFIECVARRIIDYLPKETLQPNQYLTIKEAAGRIQLSPAYVRNQIRSGSLPASNVGSSSRANYRISELDLERFMEEKKALDYVNPTQFWVKMTKRHDLN